METSTLQNLDFCRCWEPLKIRNGKFLPFSSPICLFVNYFDLRSQWKSNFLLFERYGELNFAKLVLLSSLGGRSKSEKATFFRTQAPYVYLDLRNRCKSNFLLFDELINELWMKLMKLSLKSKHKYRSTYTWNRTFEHIFLNKNESITEKVRVTMFFWQNTNHYF